MQRTTFLPFCASLWPAQQTVPLISGKGVVYDGSSANCAMEEKIATIQRICKNRRTVSHASKVAWATAEKLCIEVGMKMCSKCEQVYPFARFNQDKAGFCGLRNRCTACYGKRAGEILHETVSAKLMRTNQPSSRVCSRVHAAASSSERTPRFETEAYGNEHLAQCKTMEVRFWQDGTCSDAGVRPLGECSDLWMPLQLKATKKMCAPFVFAGCNKYPWMRIVAIIGDGRAFILNASSAMANGQIKLNKKVAPLDMCQVTEALSTAWRDDFGRSKLYSEEVLRMQCAKNSQVELQLMMLSSFLVDKRPICWPDVRNTAVDRILPNGARAQDKAVHIRGQTYRANIYRTFRRRPVPYTSTDCDVFVFCTVHAACRILIEWRIPSEWLAAQGYLTVLEGSSVVSFGKTTSIALGLPASFKDEIFGTADVLDCEKKTMPFFAYHLLPPSYVIPPCLL